MLCGKNILIATLVFICPILFAKQPEMNYVVETVVVKPVDKFAVERRYIGTIRAEKFSLLTAKSAGIVASINVSASQKVKKGQLLVSLTSDAQKRGLELSTKSLALLQSELERNRALYKTQDVTKSQLEKLERDVLAAKSQLEEQRRAVENVEIRAPFDGTVGVPRVVLGESVQPTTNIISVMDGPFFVSINIPASRLNEIKVGQTVRLKASNSTIAQVEMSIDPITRTGFATALIGNCPSCVVGDSIFANITVHEKANAILVSRNAIYYKNGKPHVVLVIKGEDGKDHAKVKEVVVGVEQEGLTEIISGLTAGEQIIMANPKRVPDGALVTVLK